ncbi:hypothetical protein J2Y54_000546 [Sphingomonas sp. BE123]|uniref:hypothetical protein n=1 Tax=Sphingomonas sp. BE123 TaxID=2817842 RepID=UPI002860245C|nr:hypothetical protein [Sphingomonas sp. BE123]MDR6851053.1 hypothetical protein [Sphingomonas sp. BE123]
MSAPTTRIRASERPEASAHWGQVWVEADRTPPFKAERSAELPVLRRRWWPFGGRA